MIHIRIDDAADDTGRAFACGVGPDLPPGDSYFFAGELAADSADCPGCNPGRRSIGAGSPTITTSPEHAA